ncbi:MAG TPA: hypothetical protein ENJ60_03545 [Aeromonadales bacterium]|nr:hypothetical protein [Aeromonadales bacterium]
MTFQILTNPSRDILQNSPLEFLRYLGQSTIIDISGKDSSRCRVITTLIHGNEPSGFMGLHVLLKQGLAPETNMRFILPSVDAALTQPYFSNRFLPGSKDLNRCFSDIDNRAAVYQRAQWIKQAIDEVEPECIVDIHNTSGSSPSFAVAIKADKTEKHLASYFCNEMIHTDIRLGALMEQDFGCPIVTIECGGAEDIASVKRAALGLKGICDDCDRQFTQAAEQVDVYRNPHRVELSKHVQLVYSNHNDVQADIILVMDIERRNFGITHKNTHIGWIRDGNLSNLCVVNDKNENIVSDFFRIENNKIFTSRDLKFFMATDKPQLAIQDCLFYIVEPDNREQR